jgi:AraC-like DNA-binding protein
MTGGTKAMIAGCIDRMSRSACGDCTRRDACASFFSNLFGAYARPRRPTAGREERRAARPGNPFLTLLGEVARAVESKVQPAENSFRREVERHVEPLLPSGTIRIESVARALGCSRQTLYRRLKAEGVTFADLLDGLRHRLALRFVREQGLSVKEASWRLGFSEPAAFSRAFKRWTGKTPGAMRPAVSRDRRSPSPHSPVRRPAA